jgi:CheY-like chemotaxis protein
MRHRVLIIDDDPDFVKIQKTALEAGGFNVIAANDGDIGFEKANNESPELIVLDIMMKSKTEGFYVAQKLQHNQQTRQIPIIMLSGIREQMKLEQEFKPDETYLPIRLFLEKPIFPSRLVEEAKKLLMENVK